MNEQLGYAGIARDSAGTQEYSAITALIGIALAKLRTVTLVKVVSVTNNGDVSPVGFVDVLPLVNQLDGAGNSIPHQTLHRLPYLRAQGGADAIILDPKVGDVGIAAFADRDISAVKATKDQSNPGSWRSHDMADGLYFGGVLNGTPNQYVRFEEGGIHVVSPYKVRISAPDVDVECERSTVTAAKQASVSAPAISLGASGQDLLALVTSRFQQLFNTHTHAENGPGSQTEAPTQQMGPQHMTTTVKGA